MRHALHALLVSMAVTAWAQTCLVCGEIRSVREVGGARAVEKERGAVGTPMGLDTAPVVGTVAQFHFGADPGERWSFGAAGTPEMRARLGETSYEVTIAMDSGENRTLTRRDGSRFRVGQRVAVRQGEIEPM